MSPRDIKEQGRFVLWQANLIVFAVLVAMVLGYFSWQMAQTRHAFEEHVNEHAQLVAEIVATNVKAASRSQEVVEQIVSDFLVNIARFIAYLDEVEPFNARELAAYAQENGLEGIWIKRTGEEAVMSPPVWFEQPLFDVSHQKHLLIHREQRHEYILLWKVPDSARLIAVGLPARSLEQLQEQMGVKQLLAALSRLAGIDSLRLEPTAKITRQNELYSLRSSATQRQIILGQQTLLLEVESTSLNERISVLWREFFIFSGFLFAAGLLLSWQLYRYQNRHVEDLWQLHQQLAVQREDASLGRAAATISHEIRNPLNAISMGLQRLQMESSGLEGEHEELLVAMSDAVKRTNEIVHGLQRYALPLKPEMKSVAFHELIERIVNLYRPQFDAHHIRVNSQLQPIEFEADGDLLGQLVENLLKNALEAQPRGGFVSVSLLIEQGQAKLSIENRTHDVSDDINNLLEPYFTTKDRQTGLGLTLVRKIAVAHGGQITLSIVENDCFRALVQLPLKRNV
ncbi:ATP-binding protein [Desulfuromonas acetoxidans]|uniref:histidine kinase n=1 Tax=Desulfuromonas acetoxidans (strain DSM 684 / 11070) TaxID=281689 RepID=Q1JZD0_DESA6|nr:ATP-binding protein [Desulfuromonas acetoxidans]EAT15637.1 periplasmic sensor signal transduction histidine kinase [Desulfuromonas acetoxidans DSM 684]